MQTTQRGWLFSNLQNLQNMLSCTHCISHYNPNTHTHTHTHNCNHWSVEANRRPSANVARPTWPPGKRALRVRIPAWRNYQPGNLANRSTWQPDEWSSLTSKCVCWTSKSPRPSWSTNVSAHKNLDPPARLQSPQTNRRALIALMTARCPVSWGQTNRLVDKDGHDKSNLQRLIWNRSFSDPDKLFPTPQIKFLGSIISFLDVGVLTIKIPNGAPPKAEAMRPWCKWKQGLASQILPVAVPSALLKSACSVLCASAQTVWAPSVKVISTLKQIVFRASVGSSVPQQQILRAYFTSRPACASSPSQVAYTARQTLSSTSVSGCTFQHFS